MINDVKQVLIKLKERNVLDNLIFRIEKGDIDIVLAKLNQNKTKISKKTILEYLDKLSRVIDASDVKIKELDQIGAFANDDETGIIFEGIKQIQEILNDFSLKQQ